MAHTTLNSFTHGKGSQNTKWPELRAAMTANGTAWLVTPRELREMEAVAANSKPAEQPTPTPKAVAPVVEAPTAAKPATIAVTQKGEVEVGTKTPTAATAPSAMAAHPVAPCVKDPPRNWRIDPETQDILVTTTTRYAYGSAEHRSKLMQIAHGLGTAGTPAQK